MIIRRGKGRSQGRYRNFEQAAVRAARALAEHWPGPSADHPPDYKNPDSTPLSEHLSYRPVPAGPWPGVPSACRLQNRDQAVGGTMLNPVAMAIIATTSPARRRRQHHHPAATARRVPRDVGIGPWLRLGPILGGTLVDGFGWWCCRGGRPPRPWRLSRAALAGPVRVVHSRVTIRRCHRSTGGRRDEPVHPQLSRQSRISAGRAVPLPQSSRGQDICGNRLRRDRNPAERVAREVAAGRHECDRGPMASPEGEQVLALGSRGSHHRRADRKC